VFFTGARARLLGDFFFGIFQIPLGHKKGRMSLADRRLVEGPQRSEPGDAVMDI